MFPVVLTMTAKEADIIRDGILSGSLADGLADTAGDSIGRDGWEALERVLSDKLDGGNILRVESVAEATLIERAFSDTTLFQAYDREEPARKAAMRRIASSLQRKLASSFARRVSLPVELT